MAVAGRTAAGRTKSLVLAAGLIAVHAITAPTAVAQTSVPSAADLSTPEIRAQVSPRHSPVLSSEIAGKVIELPLREGERFREGERLVAIDCAILKAQLTKAIAGQEAARHLYTVRIQLGKLKSASTLEVEDAAANLAMAEAEASMRRIMVERCVITAPFAGRVGDIKVKRYQAVKEGEPLLEIIGDHELEVELVVPSRWLAWLAPGHAFTVEIDETGRRYATKVTRLAASIDPVSQSIKVFARVVEPAADLLAGMSGRAVLSPPVPDQSTMIPAAEPPAKAPPP